MVTCIYCGARKRFLQHLCNEFVAFGAPVIPCQFTHVESWLPGQYHKKTPVRGTGADIKTLCDYSSDSL